MLHQFKISTENESWKGIFFYCVGNTLASWFVLCPYLDTVKSTLIVIWNRVHCKNQDN
jgi:hypothetical protein